MWKMRDTGGGEHSQFEQRDLQENADCFGMPVNEYIDDN
jgi:hypothetical protein